MWRLWTCGCCEPQDNQSLWIHLPGPSPVPPPYPLPPITVSPSCTTCWATRLSLNHHQLLLHLSKSIEKYFKPLLLSWCPLLRPKNKLEQCMIWKHCREAGFCSTSTLTLDTFLIKRTVLFRCNSVFSCLTSVNDLNTSCGLIARMSSLSPKCTYNSVFKGINEKQNDKMIWMFWNHVLLSMKTQLQFVNSVKANQSVASSTRSPSGQHFFSEYVKATYECTQ